MYNIDFLVNELLKRNEGQTKAFMEQELLKYYNKEDILIHEQYVIARGDIKVGLVAHMDIVGEDTSGHILYDDKYITKVGGGTYRCLGGDDKCGVYVILKVLEMGFRPTVILTTQEETGCKGSRQMSSDKPSLDINYFLQLDRQGDEKGNVVFYQNDNQDFISYIKRFQPNVEKGSCSDISVLCPAYGISGCNLSVSYISQHSRNEYISIEGLNNSIDIVTELLLDEINITEPFPYKEKEYVQQYFYGWGNNNYYGTNYKNPQQQTRIITREEAIERLKDSIIYTDEEEVESFYDYICRCYGDYDDEENSSVPF